MNLEVLHIGYEFEAELVEVAVEGANAKAPDVDDSIFHVGYFEKPKYLLSLLKKHAAEDSHAIVFINFKHGVDRLAYFLTSNGFPATGTSSLLSQNQRTRVMKMFRDTDNECRLLVATDVAARGLDIKGVDLVFNFDLPDDPENYIHRIGRTGRIGSKGKAFSLVGDKDVAALGRIERYLEHELEVGWLEEGELQEPEAPFTKNVPRHWLKGVPEGGPRSKKKSGGFKRKFNSSRGPRRGPSRYKSESNESQQEGSQRRKKKFRKGPRSSDNPRFSENSSKKKYRKKTRSFRSEGKKKTHKKSATKAPGPRTKNHRSFQESVLELFAGFEIFNFFGFSGSHLKVS